MEELPPNGANRNRSIYARGADDGLWMGVLCIAVFFFLVGSLTMPLLNFLACCGCVAVPVLTYRFLRRTHVAAHGCATFSALWMQGIVMFACASLLVAVASYVFMRWMDPGFLERVVGVCIKVYRDSGTAAGTQMAADLQTLLDNNALPTPVSVAMGWLWLGIFSGSVLSVFVALIVRMRRVPLNYKR